jgi:hypothetical protein
LTVLAVSGNDVTPGTLGFLVVAGMGVVLFFLFRSMSKHLRKVASQARREEEAALTDGGGAGSRDGSRTGAGTGDSNGTGGG